IRAVPWSDHRARTYRRIIRATPRRHRSLGRLRQRSGCAVECGRPRDELLLGSGLAPLGNSRPLRGSGTVADLASSVSLEPPAGTPPLVGTMEELSSQGTRCPFFDPGARPGRGVLGIIDAHDDLSAVFACVTVLRR